MPSADSPVAGRRVRSSPRPGEPATWRRDPASPQSRSWNVRRTPVNTDAPWPDLEEAESRVLKIQTKLHQWAADDPHRRFCDLSNLVADPAFLVVAWDRVRGNRGARSAGVDGVAPRSIASDKEAFLTELRDDLKARRFSPLPVREKLIPKSGGKLRGLGIPTARDRTVQAALKLVLEPIFEADFKPVSYGFRPKRRAQDAIAEVHFFCSRSYEWVLEGDITACFDEIDHQALMDRVRGRIGDKRVLALVKAFLKAGVLSEDGAERDQVTGTPQRGILSPLLANIALSVLDEHFVVLVAGDREHAEALRAEVARCSPRRACACRRTRRGSPTSTRASSSWAFASSGRPGEARGNAPCTPTPRRRRSPPSRPRCGRCPGEARTN